MRRTALRGLMGLQFIAALIWAGCDGKGEDPFSATSGEPDSAMAGKLVVTRTKVASTCEVPGCRPGFGGGGFFGGGTKPRPASRELTVDLPGGVQMTFVRIDPGTFLMGAPEGGVISKLPGGGDPDEKPQHQVTISKGFYLGKFEVTQAQWEAVMGTQSWGGRGIPQAGIGPNFPATVISRDDTQEFVQKLNDAAGKELYRLPTEAEWEYATRAGTTTLYSFGDDESQVGGYAWYQANTMDIGEPYAHEVGQKKPNPWGLYDMHGNVYEWVSDWYGPYSSGAQTDPTGPASGSGLLRGGHWFMLGEDLHSSGRVSSSRTGSAASYIGARIVRVM